MAYLLIVLSLGLILTPIMMLQPSALERRQAKLRQGAVAAGLHVHTGTLPGGEGGMLALYQWPLAGQLADNEEWLLCRRNFDHDIHLADYWDWEAGNKAGPRWTETLKDMLPTLPDGVAGVQKSRHHLTLYWNEEKGTDVEQLCDWLKTVAARARR